MAGTAERGADKSRLPCDALAGRNEADRPQTRGTLPRGAGQAAEGGTVIPCVATPHSPGRAAVGARASLFVVGWEGDCDIVSYQFNTGDVGACLETAQTPLSHKRPYCADRQLPPGVAAAEVPRSPPERPATHSSDLSVGPSGAAGVVAHLTSFGGRRETLCATGDAGDRLAWSPTGCGCRGREQRKGGTQQKTAAHCGDVRLCKLSAGRSVVVQEMNESLTRKPEEWGEAYRMPAAGLA